MPRRARRSPSVFSLAIGQRSPPARQLFLIERIRVIVGLIRRGAGCRDFPWAFSVLGLVLNTALALLGVVPQAMETTGWRDTAIASPVAIAACV
jgi:hypothetical protein